MALNDFETDKSFINLLCTIVEQKSHPKSSTALWRLPTTIFHIHRDHHANALIK